MESANLLLCQSSSCLDEQWKRLYEGAFPAGERESADKLARLIDEGKLLYHRTVNEDGVLLCFTMVSLAPNFSFLAYMATNPQTRSGGIGTKHLQRLLQVLKERYPNHLGLFLEIEATAPKSEPLTPEEQTERLRRRKFYQQRIGARLLCQDMPYLTPRYGNDNREWEGELLVIEFGENICQEDLSKVIVEIYERFYNLPNNHALVLRALSMFESCPHTCDIPSREDINAESEDPNVTAEKPAHKQPLPAGCSSCAPDTKPIPVAPVPTCFVLGWLKAACVLVRNMIRRICGF